MNSKINRKNKMTLIILDKIIIFRDHRFFNVKFMAELANSIDSR